MITLVLFAWSVSATNIEWAKQKIKIRAKKTPFHDWRFTLKNFSMMMTAWTMNDCATKKKVKDIM